MAPWAGLWGIVQRWDGNPASTSCWVKTFVNGVEKRVFVSNWNDTQGAYQFDDSYTWPAGTYELLAFENGYVGVTSVYFPGGSALTQAPTIHLSKSSIY
jgi:hypothetical protein